MAAEAWEIMIALSCTSESVNTNINSQSQAVASSNVMEVFFVLVLF